MDVASSSSESCPLGAVHEVALKPSLDASPLCSPAKVDCACEVNDEAGPPLPAETSLNLEQLVANISAQLSWKKDEIPLQCRLKIKELMRRFDLSTGELTRYAFHDAHKYTRNLIATDNETFTLLLLVWPKGKSSCVHDHPCRNGCYVKVCEGSIVEHQYRKNEALNELELFAVNSASVGDVLYIDDDIGYHKVGNPSEEQVACTLHLYSPPFKRCSVWVDEKSPADKPLKATVTFHSEYGVLTTYNAPTAPTAAATTTGAADSGAPQTLSTVVGTGEAAKAACDAASPPNALSQ